MRRIPPNNIITLILSPMASTGDATDHGDLNEQ